MMRTNNPQWYLRTNKSFEGSDVAQVWNEFSRRSVVPSRPPEFDRRTSDLNKIYEDKTWQPQLPADINVFRHIDSNLNTIKNDEIRKNMMIFISLFKNTLSSATQHNKEVTPLPPIYLTENEEDSVYLEWVFGDFRFIFSFNQNQEESYWLLVSNENLKRYSISGDLTSDKVKSEISQIIQIALRNR